MQCRNNGTLANPKSAANAPSTQSANINSVTPELSGPRQPALSISCANNPTAMLIVPCSSGNGCNNGHRLVSRLADSGCRECNAWVKKRRPLSSVLLLLCRLRSSTQSSESPTLLPAQTFATLQQHLWMSTKHSCK